VSGRVVVCVEVVDAIDIREEPPNAENSGHSFETTKCILSHSWTTSWEDMNFPMRRKGC